MELFFHILLALFFLFLWRSHARGSTAASQEIRDSRLQVAIARLYSVWELEALQEVYYHEHQRLPQYEPLLTRAYRTQAQLLMGMSYGDPESIAVAKSKIRAQLAACATPEAVEALRRQLYRMLQKSPELQELFTPSSRRSYSHHRPRNDLFANCHTLKDVKQRFRRLALLNHPDRGGSNAAMQEIQRQYKTALERAESE
jgi:hypothetical protein